MHILFVTDGNVTYESGYRIRILSEIKELASHNVQVSVLSFLHIRLFVGAHAGGRQFCEQVRKFGGKAFLIPVFPDFRVPVLIKFVDWYQRMVLKIVLNRNGYQIIHGHGHTATYIAVNRSSHRLPVVFDMHGDVINELEHSALKSEYLPRMKQRFEQIETENVCSSAVVVSVSESLRKRCQERNIDCHPRTMIVPCAGNMQLYKFNADARKILRAKWNVKVEEPLLIYSGAAQPYQKLDKITKLFSRVRDIRTDVRMVFLISNSNAGVLSKYIEENKLPASSYIIESVPHDKVPDYLSAADLGFLIRDDLPLNRVASPTKFAEYLACGLPVVSSPFVDSVREAISQRGLGIVVDGEDGENIHRLNAFIGDVMCRRQEWILKCTADASANLSWSVFGQKLYEMYITLRN